PGTRSLSRSTSTSELGSVPPDWRQHQYFVRVINLIDGVREHAVPRARGFAPFTSPSRKPFFELLALFAAIGFLAAIMPAAIDHAETEAMVSIMSLDISMAWRAAAMP